MGLPGVKLTTSEHLVNLEPTKAKNDPFISTLGVNLALNIVNMPGIPLYFHSRRGFRHRQVRGQMGAC